ncbi:MAG: RES domain-containing protein, partial [Thermoanaerobaculia bacterium]
RRFGVTGEIHSTPDYEATQRWASALRDAGVDGVRYLCGQDPSRREIGIALFGVAGEADWPVAETVAVSEEVLHAVERDCGIHVLPVP